MNPETTIPRVGMFAMVRNRRGVISAVEPYDGETGRLHLVHLEYKDDQLPLEEQLLWELEPVSTLLEPTALPNVSNTDPMPVEDFDALLRAARWTATSPYLDPDAEGPVERQPISSPFHGAIQVEDYQIVPLLKALRMPRVNLLLADDVGLGKTIEAGLILSELLLRRRIQRVLILTPASLRLQWRDAMWMKFSLSFDLVDRQATYELRKRLGIDANPWRSFNRIISSYHYLRQADVLEQFLSACHTPEGSPHLPWDLLVLDECHNLMPSPFGDDSDLCQMLRLLTPQFEHRIFLSATPHNGHTRSFTGLLEILDPVRFSQTSELNPAVKARIPQVVMRRLKREINSRTDPPKFCTRQPPCARPLRLSPEEEHLSATFDGFRKAVKALVSSGEHRRRRAGSFAVEILGKRLLSCPTAFAESWKRCREGMIAGEAADEADVAAAERSVRQETGDDRETKKREDTAAGVVGAWLLTVAEDLEEEITSVDSAVEALGFDIAGNEIVEQDPKADTRLASLYELIDELMRAGESWRDDERLVVFTEYKTTLDYLVRRLRQRFEDDRFLTLYGGMDEVDRDLIKRAFNNPDHPVRILIATDAAAEGLDLQTTARYVLHFDCPWNPSRLEQRNGRLDRYGQARDVTVFHFMSDQDHDLQFLAHVIKKADEIREDLGSINEIFDEAAHRRLIDGEDLAAVERDLDLRVDAVRGRSSIEADETVSTGDNGENSASNLAAIAAELDLDSTGLRDTLEAALAIRAGRPQIECSNGNDVCRLLDPGLSGWSEVIDESLRIPTSRDSRGPVARMAFSAKPFIRKVGERTVFTSRSDLLLMHLSHPMIQKALSSLTRSRFPGTGESVSRWSVRLGTLPERSDALILLSVEELAVNDLRESFHHWVRTFIFPISDGMLGNPLPHRPALELRNGSPTTLAVHYEQAREMLKDCEPDLKTFLQTYATALSNDLRDQLEKDGTQARRQEEERYRSRQGEISTLIEGNTLGKLEREIEELKIERAQGQLFAEAERLEKIDRSLEEKQDEIDRRTQHYEEVRTQLEKERERILKNLLPNRYALSGDVQIFPVGIEVRLPENERAGS